MIRRILIVAAAAAVAFGLAAGPASATHNEITAYEFENFNQSNPAGETLDIPQAERLFCTAIGFEARSAINHETVAADLDLLLYENETDCVNEIVSVRVPSGEQRPSFPPMTWYKVEDVS